MSETVLIRTEAGVRHLTLNRPAQRNAMSLQMVQELRAALAAAEADDAVRVIVLRGAGGHFCAGGDIGDMAAARSRVAEQGEEAMAAVSRAFGELCVAFASTPKALVTVLEGTVMGGGFGLACVADVAIASEDASFRLPETALGVVPAQIAPFLVERLGYSEAKRLAVSGGRLDARQALALRLVHEVHANGEALDTALARALHGILQCAPGAIAATKALIAKARLQSPASLVDEAARVFSQAVLGPEGTEGTMAFMQKRKASWMPQ
jgi:isohexenylglutaconyl-CoA hydratase